MRYKPESMIVSHSPLPKPYSFPYSKLWICNFGYLLSNAHACGQESIGDAVQQSISRSVGLLLRVNDLQSHPERSGMQVRQQGHGSGKLQNRGKSVEVQSEGTKRSSSRATSLVSLLCEEHLDMVELEVKLV